MTEQTETIDLVCLRHDRYWPCHNLGPGSSEHWWAVQTISSAYLERLEEVKLLLDTEQVDTLDCNQTNDC